MADFNALETLINAYIKKNGVQAITGNILNGVLRGMVSALGKGYTIVGVATPSTDPGTLTGPCAYYASTYGTYTNFGNIVVNDGEIAMLIYDEQTWHKEKMWRLDAEASIDANVGTPSVETSFEDELLTFRFHNIKGEQGDAAGFGTVTASVDSNIGTPGVSVQTSGPDTAKNMTFQFTNLKGETGVTSVVCTVDNTIGTPSCAVSLVGQELHLDFSGLKGNKGDTGVSADYPITIYNGLDSTATDQALSAYQGKVLNDEISQLELKVDELEDGLVLSDTITKQLADCEYLNNKTISSATPHTIGSTSGYRIYYLPIKSGQTITARFNLESGYCVVGYTAVLPAEGVEVTKYKSLNYTNHSNAVTADADGYFVCRLDSTATSAYFEYANPGFGKEVKDAVDAVANNVALIDTAVNPSVKYIDISTRQQKMGGYALESGVFKGIGGTAQYLTYIPVVSGTKYRFNGTYIENTNAYANIIFYTAIPVNDDVGVVLDSLKGNGEAFDIHWTAPSNGYIFIMVKNTTSYYDAFFIESVESNLDEMNKETENVKYSIDYSETQTPVESIQSVKGYVLNTGAFTKINDDTSAITMRYFQVSAGKTYKITGTHANDSTYASIIFSESFPVSGDFGIILKMSVANASFDVTFTPDLDGYIFIYASSFTATYTEPVQKMMVKSEIFADCKAEFLKLVGVAYQQKYIVVASHKIVDANTNGSFIISVLAGEKYLVRGCVTAYASYALVGFTTDLTDQYTGAVVLKKVDSDQTGYTYQYEFNATENGYLVVWSNQSGYGSQNYIEIIRLKYRQEEIRDYYLPASFKIQTFGDSITDNSWGDLSSWVNYIADNIFVDSLTIVNSGIGGSTVYGLPSVVQNGGTNAGGNPVLGLEVDVDFVNIFIGTNDWASGLDLADCQASLATVLQYITENSKAKILFCTPLQRYNATDQGRDTNSYGEPINANNISLREFCDGLSFVCKQFSVPVLNLNGEAGINRYNIQDYSLDGLHPHRGGDIYVSRLICKRIKEMLRN